MIKKKPSFDLDLSLLSRKISDMYNCIEHGNFTLKISHRTSLVCISGQKNSGTFLLVSDNWNAMPVI